MRWGFRLFTLVFTALSIGLASAQEPDPRCKYEDKGCVLDTDEEHRRLWAAWVPPYIHQNGKKVRCVDCYILGPSAYFIQWRSEDWRIFHGPVVQGLNNEEIQFQFWTNKDREIVFLGAHVSTHHMGVDYSCWPADELIEFEKVATKFRFESGFEFELTCQNPDQNGVILGVLVNSSWGDRPKFDKDHPTIRFQNIKKNTYRAEADFSNSINFKYFPLFQTGEP